MQLGGHHPFFGFKASSIICSFVLWSAPARTSVAAQRDTHKGMTTGDRSPSAILLGPGCTGDLRFVVLFLQSLKCRNCPGMVQTRSLLNAFSITHQAWPTASCKVFEEKTAAMLKLLACLLLMHLASRSQPAGFIHGDGASIQQLLQMKSLWTTWWNNMQLTKQPAAKSKLFLLGFFALICSSLSSNFWYASSTCQITMHLFQLNTVKIWRSCNKNNMTHSSLPGFHAFLCAHALGHHHLHTAYEEAGCNEGGQPS